MRAALLILSVMLQPGSHSSQAMNGAQTASPLQQAKVEMTAKLKARLATTPVLALTASKLAVQMPDGQEMGSVAWVCYDAKTRLTWILQRGDKADPVIAVDAAGKVVHSFGRGLYTIPHAIRVDPEGNVWTVDAGSSKVMKFSPEGRQLLLIDVGDMPVRKNGFAGTTDIAFGPKGHVFITDGYANARVVEYAADGTKVKEWGSAGTGPGEFHLPHSIVIDGNTVWVADRENGRIERFDLEGKYLGEIETDGRTYCIRLGADGSLWAGVNPLDGATSDPGWLVKIDKGTGKFLGYIAVDEKSSLHSVDVGSGVPMVSSGTGVLRFSPR
jgi:sugar lactone lactonase YvrE